MSVYIIPLNVTFNYLPNNSWNSCLLQAIIGAYANSMLLFNVCMYLHMIR